MNALVVYDSTYGNTEKIAEAIAEAIGAQARRVAGVTPADLKGAGLLIVGSPTHGGWFTPEIKALLAASTGLGGVRVAAFDTRVDSRIGKLLFGFAAPRLARTLEQNGGKLVAPPEGFFVQGTQGPLKDGELQRAAAWARGLAG